MISKNAFLVTGACQVLVAACCLVACSSPQGNAVDPSAAGADDNGPEPSGGSGGSADTNHPATGSESCDHLLVDLPGVFSASDVQGLAVKDDKVFVTTEGAQTRVVSEVGSGTVEEVGRVPNGSAFILGPSALAGDDDALYLDVIQGSTGNMRNLMRLPRAGGEATLLSAFKNTNGYIDPPFLTDSKYAYLEQVDAINYLSRVTLADASVEKVRKDAFYGDGYLGMGADATSVYVASVDLEAGSYTMRVIGKAPSEVGGLQDQATYLLGDCMTSPGALVTDKGDVYVGCGNEGGKLRQIYRLTVGAPDSTNTAHLVQSGAQLEYEHFAVNDGTLYFTDQKHLYSVPVAGGTPKLILSTYGVAYITTDAENVYLAGACGVQKAPL